MPSKAPLRLKPVPFAEAIAHTAKRGLELPEVYYGALQGIERTLAFSVAGIASLDQLQQTLDSLTAAMQDGMSFEQWQEQALKAPTVAALPPHRLDNIFRTNIQGAYARGRCVHIEAHKKARPFLMYSAINDSRVRPHHLAMHGHTAPVGDAVWKQWTPPCGYRCRCTVHSLTEAQAKQRAEADDKRLRNDEQAREARDKALREGPDKGWDYSPCEAMQDRTDGGLPRELQQVFEAKQVRYSPTLRERLRGLFDAVAKGLAEAARRKD